jgi:hypothetical protein
MILVIVYFIVISYIRLIIIPVIVILGAWHTVLETTAVTPVTSDGALLCQEFLYWLLSCRSTRLLAHR